MMQIKLKKYDKMEFIITFEYVHTYLLKYMFRI